MAKRFILTIIAIGLLSSSAFSQAKPSPSVENNLYVKALFACLEANAKAFSIQTNPPYDVHNVIVQKDKILTSDFPTQIGVYRIEYLDAQALINRYKAKKAEFPIIVIRPMKNEGAKLVISFTDYVITYEKKTLNYALTGGFNVSLRYDCDKQEYVIEKTDLWGV
jgi:hypothetical protein